MNEIINCTCPSCKKIFTYTSDRILVVFPCQHLIHKKCYLYKNNTCFICNKNIEEWFTLEQLYNQYTFKKIIYKQSIIDLLSVTIKQPKVSYFNVFLNTGTVIDTLYEAFIGNGYNSLIDRFFSSSNVTILYKDMENYLATKNKKKIFICNHHSLIDPAIIYRIFNSGFVANASAKNEPIVSSLYKKLPILYTDRRFSCKTTDKINEHVQKHGSICIFPEGIVGNSKTLFKFRTGAFNSGHPVQPVVIKYSEDPSALDIKTLLLKILEGNKVNIYVDILPLETGPFDENKIELIRTKMAVAGGFMLSRVSNRDINVA